MPERASAGGEDEAVMRQSSSMSLSLSGPSMSVSNGVSAHGRDLFDASQLTLDNLMVRLNSLYCMHRCDP